MTTVDSRTAGSTAARRAMISLAIFALLAILLFVAAPDGLYLWIKAFHVVAVISWMAGMLYLPRLFVYHSEVEIGSAQSETFKMMESRLLRLIINPAMIATWVFGLWLAWKGFDFTGGWLHAKIALVILLSAFHGYLSRSQRQFQADRNTKSSRHWRLMNEIPTLLMIVIVILVIVKPF